MLKQKQINLEGIGKVFIDQQSDKCIDGKKCDTNGCMIYDTSKGRFRERDFKEYRKFSPQFRHQKIYQHFVDNNIRLNGQSCSCSKCGTVAIDEAFWI